MLIINSLLKHTDVCVQEWKLSNLEAVHLVKEYTSDSARGVAELNLNINSTWEDHEWSTSECHSKWVTF